MLTFLIVLVIIAAILLILVVLAQNPKGGGLSSQFGGSGTSQLMGVKRTGDFLEKTTWALSIVIVAICLTSFMFVDRSGQAKGITTPSMERASEQQIMNTDPAADAPLGIEDVPASTEEEPVENLDELLNNTEEE